MVEGKGFKAIRSNEFNTFESGRAAIRALCAP